MFCLPRWDAHANSRKKRHGISETQIAHTWLYGEPTKQEDGSWRLIGEEITLILSKEGDFIITMYPNKHKDRFTAKVVSQRREDGNIREEWYDAEG